MENTGERTDAAVRVGRQKLAIGPEAQSTGHVSLEGVHGTVDVPIPKPASGAVARYVGPAILVSVGYMDPGNWGTDLQGGAQYQIRLALGCGRWPA